MNAEPEMEGALQEELLSLDEAVRFLDTSKSTLYRLLNQGDVKGVKVGKQWRFRRADLIAYLERSPASASVNASAHADLDDELEYFSAEWEKVEGAEPLEDAASGTAGSPESKVARLVALILHLAVSANSSDVHLAPTESGLRLRFRIDGVLHETRLLPTSLSEPVVALIKEMMEMNVLEKRLPQDGRARFISGGVEFDLRTSVIPAIHGESIVVRFLNRTMAIKPLEQIATIPGELDAVRTWMQRSSGIVIATAPTGSGKTTVLYSCLLEIDTTSTHVATVEDPVECALTGITQIQVNHRVGLNHAASLRCILRHDPDVVMCSEFRNLETAELAMETAVTGHLVLGSLHTADAPSALKRFVDMGLVPFLVCEEMIGVIAMRLARRLCKVCRAASSGLPESKLDTVRKLARSGGYAMPMPAEFYRPTGCSSCRNTGYRGRIPIYEILTCNPYLVRSLLDCNSEIERSQIAVDSGMRTLFADGMHKAVLGETSIEEVLRVTETWV